MAANSFVYTAHKNVCSLGTRSARASVSDIQVAQGTIAPHKEPVATHPPPSLRGKATVGVGAATGSLDVQLVRTIRIEHLYRLLPQLPRIRPQWQNICHRNLPLFATCISNDAYDTPIPYLINKRVRASSMRCVAPRNTGPLHHQVTSTIHETCIKTLHLLPPQVLLDHFCITQMQPFANYI